MTHYSSTERLGVNEVEKLFLEFNWIPRTISQTDVGLDMLVEICESGNAKGKFIAVQIKSGISFFNEKKGNNIVYRLDENHADYWLENSIPVIIVLHNLETKLTIWQSVNKNTIVKTGKNYKILIPLSNTLEKKNIDGLKKLTETSPLLNKFNKLILDKPIIDLINKGEKIVIEFCQYLNTLSGKADIKIYHVLQDKDIDEDKELEENLLVEFSAYGIRNHQSLYYFYPWANLKLDMFFYENFTDYDEDEMPGYKIVFIEDRFHNYELPVIPYISDSEFAYYRLEMSLNDFAYSFLDFFSYINIGKQLVLKF